jgi:hypothetical protein
MTSHGAPERCSAKGHGGAGLRDRGQVHLDDAKDLRKRWLLVFLLQQ